MAGFLNVTLLIGQNLKDKDLFTKQDPYCKVTCGGQTRRTKTHRGGGKNPVWNQTLQFNILSENTVHIELWDEDTGRFDDFIGRTTLDLSTVKTTRRQHVSLPVYSKSGRQHGTVTLDVSYEPNAAAMPAPVKPIPAPVPAPAHGQPAYGTPAGYPSGPAQGYPSHPQGYPGAPPQAAYAQAPPPGYPGAPSQGYPASPAGYPPAPHGYPPAPAGYPAPPPGYPSGSSGYPSGSSGYGAPYGRPPVQYVQGHHKPPRPMNTGNTALGVLGGLAGGLLLGDLIGDIF